mmetsp:Transcript_1548/g.3331  ORF Transcript_1548/g.3331 Transcript_1548/m.3331 type:complete len:515 (-) Transcript_1548:2554-4098(-)
MTLDSSQSQTQTHSHHFVSAVYRRLCENWKVLLLGQILSLLLASGGAAQATLHLSCGLSAPTFTMAFVYLGLSAIHLPVLCRKQLQSLGQRPGFLRRKYRRERLPTRDFDVDMGVDVNVDLDVDVDVDRDVDVDADADVVGSDEEDSTRTHPDNFDDDTANNNNNNKPLLHRSFLWYIILAFFDVQANTITMMAYRYTTLTSVTLFDALAIPTSMVLSRCIFFRSTRRYRPLHYLGVTICMIGVVLNVLQDYESGGSDSDSSFTNAMYIDDGANATTITIAPTPPPTMSLEEAFPHKMRGDLCAILGGIVYGLNNVLTEVTVSDTGDTTEYLGMLGLFGALISLLQASLLERDEIREFFPDTTIAGGADGFGETEFDFDPDTTNATCSASKGLLLLASFVGVTMFNYVGASRFLVISEATFLNLSLLTGDLWSVVFSVEVERIVPQPLFFAALAAVLGGVLLYEMAPSPALEKQHGRIKTNNPDGNGDDNIYDDEIEVELSANQTNETNLSLRT